MKFCQEHWDLVRETVKNHGLDVLVSKDGAEAINRTEAELSGAPKTETFDPLMSFHWHYSNIALKYGGLGCFGAQEDGTPFCPICVLGQIFSDFVAKDDFVDTAQRMAAWAREQSLLPPIS